MCVWESACIAALTRITSDNTSQAQCFSNLHTEYTGYIIISNKMILILWIQPGNRVHDVKEPSAKPGILVLYSVDSISSHSRHGLFSIPSTAAKLLLTL